MTKAGNRVMLLIPTLNEETAIRKLLNNALNTLALTLPPKYDYNIVVADGGSDDHTETIVESIAMRNDTVKLIHVPHGKGNGVRAAIHWAKGQYDYIFMLDGDGTYSPKNVPALLPFLEEPESHTKWQVQVMGKDSNTRYDIVCGARKARAPGAMSRAHVFGNAILTVFADLLYWPSFTSDLCTGMWGFRASALEELPLVAERFELEADLFSCAAKKGLRIYCGPIAYGARANGDRAKLRMWDGMLIAWHLVKRRFT